MTLHLLSHRIQFILLLLLIVTGISSLRISTVSAHTLNVPVGVAKPVHYTPAKKAPAIIVVIHGGAWFYVGADVRDAVAPEAERWHRAGYEVYNIDYRAGFAGLADVDSFYRQLSAQDNRPICLYGQSAGANLALLSARNNPKVNCVISESGPTNLPAMATVVNPAIPVYEAATKLFGANGMTQMSPALLPWSKKTPMFLAGASNDDVVPYSQVLLMKNRASWAKVYRLTPGTAKWVHSSVNPTKLKSLQSAELSFVKSSVSKR